MQAAFQLEESGDLQGAWDRYQLVLNTHPRQVNALNRLGVIAGKKSDFTTAAAYFAEAVKVDPKNAALRSNLGSAYLLSEDFNDAIVHLRKALSLSPSSNEFRYKLADCYLRLGKTDKASEHVDKLLRSEPDDEDGLALKAQIHIALGQMEEAAAIYGALIAKGAKLATAYAGLARARRYEREPSELADVEQTLERTDLGDADRYELHLAAGKFADDCGQYDRAFKHFVSGKQHYSDKFDLGAYAQFVQGLQEIITPQFFQERKGFSSASSRPVFIFGMPRSGSTLSEQIIGAHPHVKSCGEQPYFQRVIERVGFDRRNPDIFLKNISKISEEECLWCAKGYLDILRKYSRTADRLTDKMPHNFEHLWFISLLFPKAVFIHTCRDPIDNCVSCFTSPLKEFHSYSGDLTTLGRYYRLQHQLNDHWHKVLPIEILVIQYEDLINEPEVHARKLVSHAKLDWNDRCLHFDNGDNVVRTLSSWQVRQPIYNSSIGRWKNYDTHLQPLKDALGDLH